MRSVKLSLWLGGAATAALALHLFTPVDDAVEGSASQGVARGRAQSPPPPRRVVDAHVAAHRYEDLSPEVRAEYDRLQRDRLERLGSSSELRVRLDPPAEVVTLDGQSFAEVTP